MTAATYRVIYERDENGSWIARVPAVRGCHTHGRTLAQARRRIREALSLWVEDAEAAELLHEVKVPRAAREVLRRTQAARNRARRERAEAQAATASAAKTLVEQMGLGVRDAGELLGLSHQRVQQLVRG